MIRVVIDTNTIVSSFIVKHPNDDVSSVASMVSSKKRPPNPVSHPTAACTTDRQSQGRSRLRWVSTVVWRQHSHEGIVKLEVQK
jgi:hypothetical protein